MMEPLDCNITVMKNGFCDQSCCFLTPQKSLALVCSGENRAILGKLWISQDSDDIISVEKFYFEYNLICHRTWKQYVAFSSNPLHKFTFGGELCHRFLHSFVVI